MLTLGIDSSNYRSSAALLFQDNSYYSARRLLEVEGGKCGLRQSDAVFLHTKQLPEMICDCLGHTANNRISAIGVSSVPRNVSGSYMPCFLVGLSQAKTLSAALNVPVYEFSHQEGHIAAALLSANRTDLLKKPFLAFHLSGGTTEAVLVEPANGRFNTQIAAKTLDLNAGQVIDRVGVMLGLNFPAGARLEELAETGMPCGRIKICVKQTDCALSGVENICRNMFDNGFSPQDIAATAMEYIIQTVLCMAECLHEKHKDLPFVFSGGVAANSALKRRLISTIPAYFATPELSGDNAVGISLLAREKAGLK